MKHLLERRESQWINDEVRKFARFDGGKTFVINLEERGAETRERNIIQGNDFEPIL